jgi:hypothetical protein
MPNGNQGKIIPCIISVSSHIEAIVKQVLKEYFSISKLTVFDGMTSFQISDDQFNFVFLVRPRGATEQEITFIREKQPGSFVIVMHQSGKPNVDAEANAVVHLNNRYMIAENTLTAIQKGIAEKIEKTTSH